MIAQVRTIDLAHTPVYGGNRRPPRADRAPLDVAAIEEWTAANRRAIEHYRAAPNALITSRMAR